MTKIKLVCQGATAMAYIDGNITAGAVGIPVEIECDGAWDGLVKTMVAMSAMKKIPMAGVESETVVPWEVLQQGMHLYLGLEGRNEQGDVVIPTTWADCGRVKPSAEGGHEKYYPTPSEIEQVLTVAGTANNRSAEALKKAGDAEDTAAAAKEAAEGFRDSAKKYAEDAASSSEQAAGSANAAQNDAKRAATAATEAINAKTAATSAEAGAASHRNAAKLSANAASDSATAAASSAKSAGESAKEAAEKLAEFKDYSYDKETIDRKIEDATPSDYDKVKRQVAQNSTVNEQQTINIRNLQAATEGRLYRAEVTEGKAYRVDVPDNALPGAPLLSYGGNSVVRNQAVVDALAAGVTYDRSPSVAEGSEYWGNLASNDAFVGTQPVVGHKYLIAVDAECDSPDFKRVNVYFGQSTGIGFDSLQKAVIHTVTANQFRILRLYARANTSMTVQLHSVQIVDLTQWFGSDADAITTPEQAYAMGVPRVSMAFDAGTVVSADVESVDVADADGAVAVSKPIPEAIRNLPGYGETGSLIDLEHGIYTAPDGSTTDISDLIPAGFADMTVEAGGSITFKQTALELPVNNKVKWLVKVDAPDLTDYVKNTDYATADKGGAVKVESWLGHQIASNGALRATPYNATTYQSRADETFISKGTLQNVLAAPSIMPALTPEEQLAGRQRLGLEKRWELIESITLRDDTTILARNIDPDGTPYAFRSVRLEIYTDGNQTDNKAYGVAVNYKNTGEYLDTNSLLRTTVGGRTDGKIFMMASITSTYGEIQAEWLTSNGQAAPNANATTLIKASKHIDGDEINSVALSTYEENGLKAGYKIKIYAIRA